MEMKRTGKIAARPVLWVLMLVLWVLCLHATAQPPVKKFFIKDGKQCIELSKNISDKELELFMQQYNLNDLALERLIRQRLADSLKKQGWHLEQQNNVYILTKPMLSFDNFEDPVEVMVFTEREPAAPNFAPSSHNLRFGINKFRNKRPFTQKDETVTFFLRENLRAKTVKLAGSFTNWQYNAFPMVKTDSGWIAHVKLKDGKHWYKFVIDGDWVLDNDNQLRENDSKGNTNSVFYKTNVVFRLQGHTDARRVNLAGSFNNWRQNDLQLFKTNTGWWLPIYLPEGTHTYKFIVDGQWMRDPGNHKVLPDGHGAFNSYIAWGRTHMFRLEGFENARKVAVAGTFNGWKSDELFLIKTGTGWALPYIIGPGNYEYKFVVDGKWISDPDNPYSNHERNSNSFLVIEPNYTFRLKGYANAKNVFIAGDFNGWNPRSLSMKREGSDWVFSLHLTEGKHRYKYHVDGKWILDPTNKLWEQNEYGTGNSIVWIGE